MLREAQRSSKFHDWSFKLLSSPYKRRVGRPTPFTSLNCSFRWALQSLPRHAASRLKPKTETERCNSDLDIHGFNSQWSDGTSPFSVCSQPVREDAYEQRDRTQFPYAVDLAGMGADPRKAQTRPWTERRNRSSESRDPGTQEFEPRAGAFGMLELRKWQPATSVFA